MRFGVVKAIVLGAAVLVASCAKPERVVVGTTFPAELAEDCPARAVPLNTWGDLATAYTIRDQDLARCNADKAALRVWLAEIQRQ